MTKNSAIKGKESECVIYSKLLSKDIVPYTPLADCEGIDCIVKVRNKYKCLQIKSSHKAKQPIWFQVTNLKPKKDLFVVCCKKKRKAEDEEEIWVIPSKIFKKYSNKSGTTYDLNLDSRQRGKKRKRREILKRYKCNPKNDLAKLLR